MTKRKDFADYCFDYSGSGFVWAIMIALIVAIFGVGFYSGSVSSARKKHDFYLALEGKKTDNHEAVMAAIFIRDMVKWEKSGKSGLENLQDLIKADNGLFYNKLYLAKKRTIDEIIGGKNINLSDTVKVPVWWGFWKWFLPFFWLWLALWTTGQLITESGSSGESILEWPWKKAWTYPVILFMSPVLLPAMLVETGYRIAKGTFRQTITGTEPEPYRERTVANPPPPVIPVSVINEERLLEKKLAAQEKIAAAKANTESSKQDWVDYRLRRADKKRKFEKDIGYLREDLSRFGFEITRVQRELAKKQKEFEAHKKEAPTNKDLARDKYLKDFEQIGQLAHVEAVELRDNRLYVFTDTLFITHQGKKYEIGNFAITIDMAENQILETRNLCSTHRENRDHPYAYDGKRLCFGALGDRIYDALSKNEAALAVQYVLLALQSAEGDRPDRVQEWKEVRQ